MNLRDRKEMLHSADEALRKAGYDPKKLMLFHTAVAVGVSALVTFLGFWLTRQIDATGGLAGMGMRSVLETAQSLLDTAVLLLLPVWEVGILFAAVQMHRGKTCEFSTLAEGFRRFLPMVRLLLLEALVYAGIALAGCYLGIMLYTISPLSTPMVEALTPIAAQITTQAQLEELMADPSFILQFMDYAVVMFAVMAVGCLALLIPVSYRLRMARYLLLDEPVMGALGAMSLSGRMMRGNKIAMFRLDLQFWWFYALKVVIVALGMGAELLTLAGVSLPIPADAAFWMFYGLYAVAQLALYTFARARVEVTYAAAYDCLRQTLPQLPGESGNAAI